MGIELVLCHDAKLKTYYIDLYKIIKSMATFPYEDNDYDEENHDA